VTNVTVVKQYFFVKTIMQFFSLLNRPLTAR